MKVKKFLLLPVLLFSTLAALSGCGKSVPVETDAAVTQTTAEPVKETSAPDLTTAAPESESRSETQASEGEADVSESESDPILDSEQETPVTSLETPSPSSVRPGWIDEHLENAVAEMNCSGSINRFRENGKVSQSEMSSEEIARLLVDQNIVCFYTFQMDALIYYDRNYKDERGSNVKHYLFSSYSELSDFVYSAYVDQYAADLLSNLYGHMGELFQGDDSCLLYDPSVQGINVLLGDPFSEYTCEIIEMSESQMKFAVTFEENSQFSRIEVCAVLQDGEWRLEKMFPDIQQKNPNIM